MAGKGKQAHSPQNRYCRQTQPADSPPGTGLKETATVGRPCSKQQLPTTSCTSRRAGKWGECNVLALRKAGADLPILSLPHLSPLPITVPTHSLNL